MCVYKTRVWSAWMMPCFICLKWSIYYRVTVINAQCMYQCAKYHFSVFLIIKVTWVTPNSNMKETCEKFIMIQCPQSNIWCIQFSQFTCSVMFYSLRPHGLQHASLPCPSPTPRAYSNSCPSIRWCHPTISSCHPLLLLPSIFPSIRVFSWWVSSLHQVAKVLEFQLQHSSFQWIFRTDFL